MKDIEYIRLVEIIHRQRTWVDALLPKGDALLVARSGVELVPVFRKVMTLIAVRPRSVYPKGHVWNIQEERLDRAVRALKRDRGFASRWKKGTPSITDVNAIVLHATNGFLDPDLDPYE